RGHGDPTAAVDHWRSDARRPCVHTPGAGSESARGVNRRCGRASLTHFGARGGLCPEARRQGAPCTQQAQGHTELASTFGEESGQHPCPFTFRDVPWQPAGIAPRIPARAAAVSALRPTAPTHSPATTDRRAPAISVPRRLRREGPL